MKRLREWFSRRRGHADPQPACPVMPHLDALDNEVHVQLQRAVALSESQTLDSMTRAADLRRLSTRLVSYLEEAHEQSVAMQGDIEQNARIISELGAFVQQLPLQIAQEREHFSQLVSEVKKLQDLTETIRRMARQTEILAINAAIEAARAGESGRGFAVLAGEVRRLANESNNTAGRIEHDIAVLVERVEGGYSSDFQARARHNETESQRLSALSRELDESYVDMRQFYQLIMSAVTQHNTELDHGIAALLDTGQFHDVFKQIIDRVAPATASRQDLVTELVDRLRAGRTATDDLAPRAAQLVQDYLDGEAQHRDPDAAAHAQPGEPGARIELF